MVQHAIQTIHVRYAGRSIELSTATLNMPAHTNDTDLKRAIEQHIDLPLHALDTHVVVRSSQAVIIRPEAIYG